LYLERELGSSECPRTTYISVDINKPIRVEIIYAVIRNKMFFLFLFFFFRDENKTKFYLDLRDSKIIMKQNKTTIPNV